VLTLVRHPLTGISVAPEAQIWLDERGNETLVRGLLRL
jgi:hypothetical protein